MKKLFVVKIGGNVLDDASAVANLSAKLARLENPFILVHGGGKAATGLAEKLGIPQQMHDGRRITDAATLDVAVMVYAGLINKKLVALLQKNGKNAIGLCGADAGTVLACKRPVGETDFGLVGDIAPNGVDAETLSFFIEKGVCPVFCAITHNGQGQLLNTNADTMAAAIASAMSQHFHVELLYLFEKGGVLKDMEDTASVISVIRKEEIPALFTAGIIAKGMLPKLKNAGEAAEAGVKRVMVGSFEDLEDLLNETANAGTRIIA